jgi:hypothetical protein
VATGLPAGRYLAGGIRGLTQPEPPEEMARGRDGVERVERTCIAPSTLPRRGRQLAAS